VNDADRWELAGAQARADRLEALLRRLVESLRGTRECGDAAGKCVAYAALARALDAAEKEVGP
jgi:hypothetical protein